ncbi:hypothetical protein NDU88_000695 [Pleurodeles waltl]|uniref:Uncharacterized protein n=1 Tax=Pleurodeles waltl TaxID=8319 RepID=A0AAV7LDT8_PLEWA|nr:hypothetical protein NDU88_000695 [Pleurodeles waltl]
MIKENHNNSGILVFWGDLGILLQDSASERPEELGRSQSHPQLRYFLYSARRLHGLDSYIPRRLQISPLKHCRPFSLALLASFGCAEKLAARAMPHTSARAAGSPGRALPSAHLLAAGTGGRENLLSHASAPRPRRACQETLRLPEAYE